MDISELGTIRKSWRGRISVALVYPNRYHLGMSSLGFQTVWRLFNQNEDVVCERMFLPESASDGAEIRIRSIESLRPLRDFNIIAFSVSYEQDYLNILKILDSAGIPVDADDREDHHPMVIAGGVACFLNPEPIARFIDVFLIGEAEMLIPDFLAAYRQRPVPSDRKSWLKHLAHHITGVYVPQLYQPIYDSNGKLCDFKPACEAPARIQRAYLKDIAQTSTYSAILTPDTAFDSTFLIEVSRGCAHGCRFCSAGYVYRPPRFRPISLLENCLNAIPFQEKLPKTFSVGLLGAAVSDLPGLETLCRQAHERRIRLSFSSLRADALTDELAAALKQSGVKTATIAPDAGSQRMRNVINKGITEDHILNAAERLVAHGILNLKLYFMIGLPFETWDDVNAILELCTRVKRRFLEASRIQRRIGQITVSVNAFVPKPFTPFQWAAMDDLAVLKKKISAIRKGLQRLPNIRLQAENPRNALIQAMLSLGDRRISNLLMSALQTGGNWAAVLKTSESAIEEVRRERLEHERLAWEFIEHGIHKSFLFREYQKAREGKTSAPCPLLSENRTDCRKCGVCQMSSESVG